jgi:DNA mismatch repair ATPase MutS
MPFEKGKSYRQVVRMEEFNRLVSQQMKTMDRLLFLQGELERCQEIEEQLKELQEESRIESVQLEIEKMKDELTEIQRLFEAQTEEVIRSYQEISITAG